MNEFGSGKLHSGNVKNPLNPNSESDRKQALAIAYAVARKKAMGQ